MINLIVLGFSLFLALNVLLKLLNAQISSTYTNVQNSAQQTQFIRHAALIVTIAEQSSLLPIASTFYVRKPYNVQILIQVPYSSILFIVKMIRRG